MPKGPKKPSLPSGLVYIPMESQHVRIERPVVMETRGLGHARKSIRTGSTFKLQEQQRFLRLSNARRTHS